MAAGAWALRHALRGRLLLEVGRDHKGTYNPCCLRKFQSHVEWSRNNTQRESERERKNERQRERQRDKDRDIDRCGDTERKRAIKGASECARKRKGTEGEGWMERQNKEKWEGR